MACRGPFQVKADPRPFWHTMGCMEVNGTKHFKHFIPMVPGGVIKGKTFPVCKKNKMKWPSALTLQSRAREAKIELHCNYSKGSCFYKRAMYMKVS